MYKSDFEILIMTLPENSVKRACYVVREYIKNDFSSPLVSEEEFYSSLRILLAHAYQTSDDKTTVEQWYCENDCDRNNGLFEFCPGEFQINGKSRTLCKYYIDSGNK